MLTQIAITVSVLISFGADDGDEPETRHQDRGDKDDMKYTIRPSWSGDAVIAIIVR